MGPSIRRKNSESTGVSGAVSADAEGGKRAPTDMEDCQCGDATASSTDKTKPVAESDCRKIDVLRQPRQARRIFFPRTNSLLVVFNVIYSFYLQSD